MKLPQSYFIQPDVVDIAIDLLGKVLYSCVAGKTVSGIITETEAYAGITDKASHAFGGKLTDRTEIMYRKGGCSYIYLCYGIHSLFNIVTNDSGVPHAVLIRGLAPLRGQPIIRKRLNKLPSILKGPGVVGKALGIHYSMSGTSLSGDVFWMEDIGVKPDKNLVLAGPRIGVEYAGDDALLPYRFLWKTDQGSTFV